MKNKLFKIASLFLLSVFLAGCASTGGGAKVIGIDCFSIGEPGKGDTYLAQFASLLTPEYQVIQAPIMKDSGKTK